MNWTQADPFDAIVLVIFGVALLGILGLKAYHWLTDPVDVPDSIRDGYSPSEGRGLR